MAEISNTATSAREAETNSMPATEDGSLQDKFTDLSARATALYAVKKYEEAAELYSEATEIQAEINGEMSEANADILFAYGRCLFRVALETSEVLGGPAASAKLKGNEKKPSKKRKANGSLKAEAGSSSAPIDQETFPQPIVETTLPADVIPAEDGDPEKSKASTTDKPLFQIEGDAAGWTDSEEEDDAEEAEAEPADEEEVDDFNTSFEILDMSRIIYLHKLDSLKATQPPPDDLSQQIQHLHTRLSDIYDLQAEISLEGENFTAAADDLRSCLDLKLQLYPTASSQLAECHYKLSIALEAASQVQQRDIEGNPVGEIQVDWTIRNDAVAQMASAIESCKLRIVKETQDFDAIPADKEKEKTKASENIEDVKDMMQVMEQRLGELKKPPVSVKAEAEKEATKEMMGTIMGQMLGANGGTVSKEEQKVKLAEIVSNANDLTGMVKRKKPKSQPPPAVVEPEANGKGKGKGKGKRAIEEVEGDGEVSNGVAEETKVKKVRIQDVID